MKHYYIINDPRSFEGFDADGITKIEFDLHVTDDASTIPESATYLASVDDNGMVVPRGDSSPSPALPEIEPLEQMELTSIRGPFVKLPVIIRGARMAALVNIDQVAIAIASPVDDDETNIVFGGDLTYVVPLPFPKVEAELLGEPEVDYDAEAGE